MFGREHVDRYRETDGEEGHDWQRTTVLPLTTTGRNLVRQGQGAVMQLIGRRIETDEGAIVLAGPDDIQGDLQAAICSALA